MQSHINIAFDKLNHALGEELFNLLLEGLVDEIMLNPDGNLYVKYKDGQQALLKSLSVDEGQLMIRQLVSMQGLGFDEHKRIIDCQISELNTRICAIMPPIVQSPVFCLRKLHALNLTFEDLIYKNFLSSQRANLIERLLLEKKNILICGQTGCGKTSFINALLNKLYFLDDNQRIVCIEDTKELAIKQGNFVNLYTNAHTSMSDLVKASLRLSPDRIIVGEVRSFEALDMIDAISTGHKGAIASLHAGSVEQCVERLKLLISKNKNPPSNLDRLIALSIDVIVILKKEPQRHIETIAKVQGFDGKKIIFEYL